MTRRALAAAVLVLGIAGTAQAGAPERSIRPMPRPVVAASGEEVAASADAAAAVTAAVTSATVRMTSPRPLPRPREVSVSAAPSATVVAAARPVVPAVRAKPADPIAAFFQGLAAPKAGGVGTSKRPEQKPNGFAELVAAITPPMATSRAGSVCGVPDIKGEALKPIEGAGACGVDKPVRVTSVAGVALSQAPTIDCETAIALNDWVKAGVLPAVGRTGGGVARIDVMAHYACRSRNNQRGAKLSEHALGHAVDIGGVTLQDGSQISVLDHWRSRKLGGIVKAWHASACGTFGTVLGPNADRFHQNHLHLDTARYRSGSYCR